MANAKDIKVGDVVRVKNDKYISYGVYKGENCKVTYKSGSTIQVQIDGYGPLNLNALDVDTGPQTRTDILEELGRLREAVKVREDRLKWMEQTKSETYDEDEFKIWQILGTMDAKGSKITKARAIAAIIKK